MRPHPRVTLSLFGAFTSAHYTNTPKQPAIQDKRVPQVPRYHIGAGVIAETPRVATFSVQARFVGAQFEDDLNELTLEDYVVVDASASRPLTRAVHLFLGVENLFDVEYDVGRTPVRIDRLAVHRARRREGFSAVSNFHRRPGDQEQRSVLVLCSRPPVKHLVHAAGVLLRPLSPVLRSHRSSTNPATRTSNPATITAIAHSGWSNQCR